MLAPLVFALTASGPPLLAVEGNSDCPTPTRVAARLQEVLAAAPSEALAERAILSREGAALTVLLEGEDGRTIGERRLAVEGDCETLAGAVAVVLAVWLSDVHPEFVAPLPESSLHELPLSAPVAETPVPASAISPPPRAPVRVAAAASPSAPPKARRFGTEVGFGASLAGGQAAPVASFALAWAPAARSGWGLSVAFQPQGVRRSALGSGEAVWSRWPLAVGPLLRLASDRSVLDLSAAAAVGLLRIDGEGFASGRSQQDVTAGVLGRIQLGGASGVFEPFVALQALYWLRAAEVYTLPARSSIRLPSLDLTFLVGISVRP